MKSIVILMMLSEERRGGGGEVYPQQRVTETLIKRVSERPGELGDSSKYHHSCCVLLSG